MSVEIKHSAEEERIAIMPKYLQRAIHYSVLAKPDNLTSSFALRYEVYCRERNLLTCEQYPSQLETDHFDDCSIHVGGTDETGSMRGTIRLVRQSPIGLPLLKHCDIYPEFRHLLDERIFKTSAEVSRLAIPKTYRAKPQLLSATNNENFTSLQNAHILTDRNITVEKLTPLKADVMLGLYKTIYQVSKREGITHWFAAMERSLVRLMRRFHFEFTPIGPEVDYYGPVIPYIVAISTIEEALFRRCPDTFSDFVKGLEPELVPIFQDLNK